MSRKKLEPEEISKQISLLKDWAVKEGALFKSFRFKDFREAFTWMTRVAFEAEEMNHHPDWYNVYNRVDVRLNTHDVHGITELDFKLAKKMDEIKES